VLEVVGDGSTPKPSWVGLVDVETEAISGNLFNSLIVVEAHCFALCKVHSMDCKIFWDPGGIFERLAGFRHAFHDMGNLNQQIVNAVATVSTSLPELNRVM